MYTTPCTAAAARVHVPHWDDYKHSPWLCILGHGDTIQRSHDSFLFSSLFDHSVHTGLWGGVTIGSVAANIEYPDIRLLACIFDFT
jgi:hypothetical protein